MIAAEDGGPNRELKVWRRMSSGILVCIMLREIRRIELVDTCVNFMAGIRSP